MFTHRIHDSPANTCRPYNQEDRTVLLDIFVSDFEYMSSKIYRLIIYSSLLPCFVTPSRFTLFYMITTILSLVLPHQTSVMFSRQSWVPINRVHSFIVYFIIRYTWCYPFTQSHVIGWRVVETRIFVMGLFANRKGKIGKVKMTDKEFLGEIILENLVIMIFCVIFVQRNFLKKHLDHHVRQVHHVPSILSLVPEERATCRVLAMLRHLHFF